MSRRKKPPSDRRRRRRVLVWTDRVVSYGLVVIGACLLLGLLTRLNCLGGALFLIMLYLAIPPFPWSPENIKAEGHYFFVNKNLIIALALLALATRAAACGSAWTACCSTSTRGPTAQGPDEAGRRESAERNSTSRKGISAMSLYLTPEQKEAGKKTFADAAAAAARDL